MFVCFSLGNENGIKELASAALSVLQEHELVQLQAGDDDEGEEIAQPKSGANLDQLRGTWMYLMLNSDNGDTKACHWSPQCVHLLNQLPAQLPQLVAISVALLSGMQEQLFEFFACGPHWLTRQYFDSFNETLSHVVSDKCAALRHICSALCSVTKSICYQALAGDDCSATSASLVSNAQRLLQRHLLSSEERLRGGLRSAAARRRYLGEAVRQLIEVALHALEVLKTPPQLPKYFPLYALRSTADSSGAAGTTTTEAALHVVSKLQGYVEKLLDAVEGLLPLVSVDTYMSWAEMESGLLLFHLQGYICCQARRLQQLLDEDEVLRGHSLRQQLTTFAGGAQSFEERLAALTLGELLGLLDGEMGVVSDQQLLLGLEELLKRSIAYGNEECVETMAKHVRLLGVQHARLILQHLAQVKLMRMQQNEGEQEQGEEPKQEEMDMEMELESSSEGEMEEVEEEEEDDMYDQLVSQVLQPIFVNCRTSEKLELLQLRDEMKLLGHFSFKVEDYDSRRVFFFNQLSSSQHEFPINTFLDLCYEQPQQSWLSLAELAMVHPRYAMLYARVGMTCAQHALHHVGHTVRRLMLNERLLSICPAELHLLPRLYETPVVLRGMMYHKRRMLCLNLRLPQLPYTSEQLRAAQQQYLASLAAGLAKFSESGNYRALGYLVQTLQQLEQVERRLIYSSRRCVRKERGRFRLAKRSGAPWRRLHERYLLAKSYLELNSQMPEWRHKNWTLVSQLIRTMDTLRVNSVRDWSVGEFEDTRMSLLDQIMAYYVRSMPQLVILNPGG